MAKDHYGIPGVSRGASGAGVKKACRKLAMQYHPSCKPCKGKWANDKFKEVNEAYGAPGDPQKRNQHDHFGTVGNAGDISSSPFTATTLEEMMKDFGGAGLRLNFLDEVFGDFLKGSGPSLSFRTFGSKEDTKGTREEIGHKNSCRGETGRRGETWECPPNERRLAGRYSDPSCSQIGARLVKRG